MPLFQKVTIEEKLNFVETFSLLLKSGITIDLAFKDLAKNSRNPILKKLFYQASERIAKGTPIYQVFEDSPHFEKVFASFIRVGEESGTLEEALKYLAELLKRQNTLEKEISAATLYPKIILFFAIFIAGGIFYFVFPKLLPLFESLNVTLPLQTRILLFLANFFRSYGLVFFLVIALFFLFFKFLFKLNKVKIFFDKMILKIPFVGDL
jgi:type IV pilus assembly protein PilC